MSDGVLPVRWKDCKLSIARFHFMCFYRLPSAAFALVLKQIIVLDNRARLVWTTIAGTNIITMQNQKKQKQKKIFCLCFVLLAVSETVRQQH